MIEITWAAALLLAACGGDGTRTPDAASIDATATIDATPTIDAPGDIDAASIPDAMSAPPDAAADIDAAPGDIAAICTHVCEHVFIDCLMVPPEPECQIGCEADLIDCTPDQLDAVDACGDVPCTADLQDIADCLTAVACID